MAFKFNCELIKHVHHYQVQNFTDISGNNRCLIKCVNLQLLRDILLYASEYYRMIFQLHNITVFPIQYKFSNNSQFNSGPLKIEIQLILRIQYSEKCSAKN